MMQKFEDFISHFQVKERTKKGNSIQCKCICPSHNDKKASLSVSCDFDRERIALHCHADCRPEDVLAAVGLSMKDLFLSQRATPCEKEAWISFIEKATGKEYRCKYDHIDLEGKYVCSKIRLCPKDFRYGVLNGDRFSLGLSGRKRKDIKAFYCKDYEGLKKAIREGQTVYYVEGEKDVNTLYKFGMYAVTCGSASDWNSAVAEIFQGAKVCIFADNDGPGEKLAKKVLKDIDSVVADSEIITPMPDTPHGDISDFLEVYGKDGLLELKDRAEKGLRKFHTWNEQRRKCTGVFDYQIFSYLKKTRSIFVMGKVPYIYKDGVYRADLSGAILKSMIRELILPAFVRSNVEKRIFELFLTDSDLEVVQEETNLYPLQWVNFKNSFYDPVNEKLVPHHPKYRATNQIPHIFDPEEELLEDGKQFIDSWLKFSIPDPSDRQMFLEYAGYCMTRDTGQQKFLFIKGIGGTGKSTAAGLIEKMIGAENTSHVSLHDLGVRFATYGIVDKLLNSCGDLEATDLYDPGKIKMLTGEDPMRVEAKGKDSFSYKSCAKLLYLCNQIPLVKNELSNGFYRRLLILTMNQRPDEIDPGLPKKLEGHISYFIYKCVEALSWMYGEGHLTVSENSKKEVLQVRRDSDTVQAFLDAMVQSEKESRIKKTELYLAYEKYCLEEDRAALTKKNFYKSMAVKGYATKVHHGYDCYFGLEILDRSRFENVDPEIAEIIPFSG